MEFHEKLQEFRRRKGLTQEELAERLYVSRTAVSKWESGRGYPNLESLKAIAKFFSVTVDELLSTNEVLELAEEDQKQIEKSFHDLIFGLMDLCMSLLLFLPFFGESSDGIVRAVALLWLNGVPSYLRIAYFVAVVAMILLGVLRLTLQTVGAVFWEKIKTRLSLALGAASVLLFIVCSQPYAVVFSFVLLTVKVFLLIKRQ